METDVSADGVTMAAEAEAVIQMFRVTSFRKKETENVYLSAFHTKKRGVLYYCPN